ncbi:MAG: ATP-binding cassette domain-containing protein [Prevotellaceae bacterium]|jgi:phospholipid/cholesterol/gamma-HCH transport system ATP-binding protein|nr:ATP-binding cassette domain-containing protein [Prevotellaceae bacterium]
MVEVKNLCKSFGNKEVLTNISTVFEQGKTNLIIGQSGSGKTVLLKSIVGLHEISSGEIHYGSLRFDTMNFGERKRLRRKIGMLFQGSALFDFATVVQNVMFPLEMFSDMNAAERAERANFCLKRVNILNANDLFPSEISGGMQKRVAIARAIALNPEYLFCDEPNSGLDPGTSILIDALIKEITEEYGITTVINTHDMNSVMEMGDKIVFICRGHKWWEGSRTDILHSDNEELNNFVFASKMAKALKHSAAG